MASRIRSYNAFLASAKSQRGLTHKQAQGLYRSMKERLGASPTRLSLKQHPRITAQETKRIVSVSRRPQKKVPIRSLSEYEDFFDDLDFDFEEVAAGVDYGED